LGVDELSKIKSLKPRETDRTTFSNELYKSKTDFIKSTAF